MARAHHIAAAEASSRAGDFALGDAFEATSTADADQAVEMARRSLLIALDEAHRAQVAAENAKRLASASESDTG